MYRHDNILNCGYHGCYFDLFDRNDDQKRETQTALGTKPRHRCVQLLTDAAFGVVISRHHHAVFAEALDLVRLLVGDPGDNGFCFHTRQAQTPEGGGG